MINLAICLCFKNAASYLDEWLAYYCAVGADYFYLYDNDSTDAYENIVKPYLKTGRAELHHWHGHGQQQAIYTDCLKRSRHKVRWVGFFDDDEFLWPVLDHDLPTVLERYEAYAGVAVCWYLFGASKHETRPPGGVIENFTWRASHPDNHVKCIVSPTRVRKPMVIGHSFLCEPGTTIVDEHLRNIATSKTETPSGNILRVNHYATKSLEELRHRRTQVQADTGKVTEHPLAKWEMWAAKWSAKQDLGIQRFVPKIREVQREMAELREKENSRLTLWARLRARI